MSSIEIAELTKKRHDNVLRDIRNMLDELYPASSELSYKDIQGVIITLDDKGRMSRVDLDKNHTLTLVTGYSHILRKNVVDRWQYLEDQLATLKFREGDKKHQLAAMEALSHLLPENLQGEALAYVIANSVVNKATSNLFGFPKAIKKGDMSHDMLIIREVVMDDYIKLFEIIDDNSVVSEALFKKYQPKRLESFSQE